METRNKDEGYQKRRGFDLKTITVLVVALFGSGGVTGLVSFWTDPNVELQNKIVAAEEHINIQYNEINKIKNEQATRKMRVENYIKTHDEAAQLKQLMLEQKMLHLKELLIEIRNDVKELNNHR